jgi:hypothetical protein
MAGITNQDFISSGYWPVASDTFGASGPAQTFQQIPATFVIGETRHEIDQSHKSSHQKASSRDQEKIAEENGGFSYRQCRGLAGRSAHAELRAQRSTTKQYRAVATQIRHILASVLDSHKPVSILTTGSARKRRLSTINPFLHCISASIHCDNQSEQKFGSSRIQTAKKVLPEKNLAVTVPEIESAAEKNLFARREGRTFEIFTRLFGWPFVTPKTFHMERFQEQLDGFALLLFISKHSVLLPASQAGFRLTQDQHSKWNNTCQVNNHERNSRGQYLCK